MMFAYRLFRSVIRYFFATALLVAPALSVPTPGGSEPIPELRTLWDLIEFDAAKAETGARELLTACETRYGRESIEAARVIDCLVHALYYGQSDGTEMLTLANRALAIKETHFPPTHPEIAASLKELGLAYQKQGDNSESLRVLQRALIMEESVLGADAPELGTVHVYLGNTYMQMEKSVEIMDKAIAHLEKAVSLQEARYGPDDLRLAIALRLFGGALYARDRLKETLDCYLRCLEIRKKVLGLHHIDTASIYAQTGYIFWALGEYEPAREYTRTGIDIFREVRGQESAEVANYMINLAIVEGHLGFEEEMLRLIRQSIALNEKINGPDNEDVAIGRANYGIMMSRRNPAIALRQFEQALEIFKNTLGPDHLRVAWMLNAIGNVYKKMGNLQKAGDYYEKAIVIGRKAVGSRHHQVINFELNLADIRAELGEYAGIEDMCQDVFPVIESIYGKDNPQFATELIQYGRIMQMIGNRQKAERLYNQALDILRRKQGPRHQETGKCLISMARLQESRGRYAAALDCYRRGYAIVAAVPGFDKQYLGDTLLRVAICRYNLGETETAFAEAIQSDRLRCDQFQAVAVVLPEADALRFTRDGYGGLNLAIQMAIKTTVASQTQSAWDLLIRSRALVLDEMSQRNRAINQSRDPELRRLTDEYANTRKRLAHLVLSGPDEQHPDTYRKILQQVQLEKERLERNLAERSRSFREKQDLRQAGFPEVRAALPPDSSLLAFHLVQPVPEKGSTSAEAETSPRPYYVAFLLPEPGAAPRIIPLPSAAEIDRLVAACHAQIRRTALSPDRGQRQAEAEYVQITTWLRKIIWDPIAPHLRNAKQVFVVPAGTLNFVNFASLPVDPGKYLLEAGPRFHYLSTERDLLQSPEATTGAQMLLALGNPAFDTLASTTGRQQTDDRDVAPDSPSVATPSSLHENRSIQILFKDMNFRPLPETAPEVKRIAHLWDNHHQTTAESGPDRPESGSPQTHAVMMLQARASEADFKAAAPGKQVLHLATHGFFLGNTDPDPTKGSSSDRSGSVYSMTVMENPLILSGLALAGANQWKAARSDQEDGILTAEEIAALDLSGVEWVVLSACDTGLGSIRASEGVFGLRRAFRIAGAHTVIMSLWSVMDTITRQWMEALYTNRFEKGMSTVDAVHQASLQLLRARRAAGRSTHPIFWAGFVAVGDWR